MIVSGGWSQVTSVWTTRRVGVSPLCAGKGHFTWFFNRDLKNNSDVIMFAIVYLHEIHHLDSTLLLFTSLFVVIFTLHV